MRVRVHLYRDELFPVFNEAAEESRAYTIELDQQLWLDYKAALARFEELRNAVEEAGDIYFESQADTGDSRAIDHKAPRR